MNKFRVHFSGAFFESGSSRERVEKRVRRKGASIGKVFDIEASPIHPAGNNNKEENYVLSFEGEITIQAESKEKAENQAYDWLANLGQVTVVALKDEEDPQVIPEIT